MRYLVPFFCGATLVLVLAAGGTVLLLPGAGHFAVAASDDYDELKLFGEVFERLEQDYVDPPDRGELISAAISGMVSSLDPHSTYLTPRRYREVRLHTKGTFGGLGLQVALERKIVRVIAPIDDTPAKKAGIRAGDHIIAIDGKSIVGTTLDDAIEKMRGHPGTDITLTIRRENVKKPLTFRLTRAIIKVAPVKWHRERNAGYIRISNFDQETTGAVEQAVASLRQDIGPSLVGYILDLRDNPGGLLDQAVSVSDLFLERGQILSMKGRNDPEGRGFYAQSGDITGGSPLIILVNAGSASASEIVAGALQDHRRAVILGERSFGKGSVQTLIPLRDGSAIKITTQLYYTPSGTSIQARGITPDIIAVPARVEPLEQETAPRSEARLPNHLRGGSDDSMEDEGNLEPDGTEAPAPDEEEQDGEEQASGEGDTGTGLRSDYQLQKAVDILHSLPLFGNSGHDGTAAGGEL